MRRAIVLFIALGLAGCGSDSPSAPTVVVPTSTTTTTTLPPLWTVSGSGNTVFDMPTRVARVRITGVWNGSGTSNFIVRIANRLIVNEVLRTGPYDGTHLTGGGGVTEITNSSAIAWTFTEAR